MNEALKTRLTELGLTAEQVTALEKEGVTTETDLALLKAEQIKAISGCTTVASIKTANAFAPTPVGATAAGAESDKPTDPTAEIPEGAKPSPAMVTNFATSLGMDPSMLSMMMFAGMTGNMGGGAMDISGMIPIPQIVAGYNPKVRNMFLMVMDQIQARYGVPIVVINSDGSVNQELTIEYIQGLEEGRDVAENNVYFNGAGQPFEVIGVGVDAMSIYDADPLDSTRALQKSGMGIGRVLWNGTTLELKQAVFYAVQTREIDPTDENSHSWLRDHIRPGATHLVLSGKAPKAIAMFNEGRRSGSLPTLRVMLNRAPRRKEIMPRRRSTTPRNLSGLGRTDEEPTSNETYR